MKMRKPKDDIPLFDGLAYMVANEPYQKHIAQAANNEEVCVIRPKKHGLHIYALFFTSLRGQHAKTIGQSMMPILIKHTCVPPVWVPLLVLIMVVLFPILWLIFTRENSKSVSYIGSNNLLILSNFKAKKY